MVVRQSLGTEHKEELEDGNVLLFQRNGIYQARVYRGDRKYIYRSLKTRKLDEARKSAIKFYYEIQFKREQNLPIQQSTFNAVIDEYIALRKRDYERGLKQVKNSSSRQTTSIYMLRQIIRVSKFWREYCGKKPVEQINNAVLKDYIPWRRDYYHKMSEDKRPKKYSLDPKDATLQWEIVLAKTLLKFADERGYRGKIPLPNYFYSIKRKVSRPAFSKPEYLTVIKRMRDWIKETTIKEHRYTRELLRDYVLILANSGMRIGEANNLLETDVIAFEDELGRKNYMFNVKGKTGKRTVIPRTNTVRYVERVLSRNLEWKKVWNQTSTQMKRSKDSVRLQGYEDIDKQADWFFRMPDGGRVITLIDQFKALLKTCGLEKNRYGEDYTLYSLRHMYAVLMLQRQRVGVFDIARNMGTSVQMIEHYYGRSATPIELATKLGGVDKRPKDNQEPKKKTDKESS